jgi:hypothetical protein
MHSCGAGYNKLSYKTSHIVQISKNQRKFIETKGLA